MIGASSAITSATSLLTGLEIDDPGVMHLSHNGFGGHDDSLLYLVCTDWRVMPNVSNLLPRPAFCPGGYVPAVRTRGYGAVTKVSRRARVSSMSRRVFFE